MSKRAVVQWIAIETNHRCEAEPGEIDGKPVRCAMLATWEAVRATGPDGRLIDITRPRIRCSIHFPESTETVSHVKESF